MSEQVPEKTNQGNKGGANRGHARRDEVHARNAEREHVEGTPDEAENGQVQDPANPEAHALADGNSMDSDGDGVHDSVK